ncbi:putative CUB domain-containing protein-like 10, partial [Homarus americanus]
TLVDIDQSVHVMVGRDQSVHVMVSRDQSVHVMVGSDQSMHIIVGRDQSVHVMVGRDHLLYIMMGRDQSLHVMVDTDQSVHIVVSRDQSVYSTSCPLKKSDFHRVCGTEKHAQSGWMQSIGYPQYYLGEPGVCTVTIRVDEGQHIQLTITDLSLRAIGCETPATPVDGYMAYRNATHAEYWCCVRHVFPDTHARRRLLKCNRAHTWNDTLPDCADLEELFQDGNITETQYQNMVNGSSGYAMAEMLRQAHLVYDLVVPTVIMSVLVLGNVAIVFLIIYCRRGVIEEGANCEELESIKANPEPTDVVDSKPCEV